MHVMLKAAVFLSLVPLLLLGSVQSPSFSEATSPKQATTSIHCLHDDSEDVEYRDDVLTRIDYNLLPESHLFKAVYSDEIFFRPSTEYHQLLAKQSLGMALAAFNLFAKEKEAENPDERGTLNDYFKSTGFDRVRTDDYDRETSMYTVGSAIASKEISYQGQEARLIAVAIRGGNYENEWQSNFMLGDGDRHQGFNEAATLVTDRVISYSASFPTNLPTKIWITGFSRAGAVCNLVAANLNSTATFTKDQIYAYSFAAPAAVRANDLDIKSGFNNIFNIVGASDMIPQFVPYEWGFARYGIDRQLTGSEFDPTFFYKYQAVQDRLAQLGGKTYYVPELNFRLRMLYGLLLEFSSSQEGFVELLQPVFVAIMQSNNVTTILEILRNTLIRFDQFSSATAIQKDVIIDFVLAFLQPLLTGASFMEGRMSSVVTPMLSVAHEHLPELYLYLMYSHEESDLFPGVNSFDYVVLDQRKYTLVDKESGQTLLTIDHGQKTLSPYAQEHHLDYSLFLDTSKPVLVVPHDRAYELRYYLGLGEDLSAYVIPYGTHFVANMNKYSLSVGPIAQREGVLLTTAFNEATYAGTKTPLTPSQLNADIGTERLVMSYHWYILIGGFILALILVVILWIAMLLHGRIAKRKIRVGKLGLLSLAVTCLVEAEIMFWFSANLLLYNVLFKVAGCLSLLVLYFIGKKLSDFKRIDRTVLPALLLVMASYVLASVHIISCFVCAMAAAVYLIVYHIRLARPKSHIWIIYTLSLLLGVPLSILFIGQFGPVAILYMCSLPLFLLVGFTALGTDQSKVATSFIWAAQMVAYGVFLFSVDGALAASVLFTIFAGLSLVGFALSYDQPNPSVIEEITEEKDPEPLPQVLED